MPERVHKHYPESDKAISLTVYTKSPEKWLLIDRETGQVYEGTEYGWWNKLIGKVRDIATE